MQFNNYPLSPPPASNFAQEYDALFYTLVGLTVFFSLIVGVAIVIFAVRYRQGTRADRSRPMYENLFLELTWTIVPLVLGLVMFYFGTSLYVKMRTPPKNATEIFVIGKQWMWHVQHGNGVRENNTLHVPVGKPIKLTMISQDVLHAFYIPAFRVQEHVVPGRYTQLWFTATKAGEYHLFCNMYCGTQHSEMGGKVVAMDPKDFAEWLSNGGQSVAPMSMEQTGAKIFNKVGCANCHGAEDTLRAPSLYGIYGKRRVFADGTSQVADEEYLRSSILRPYDKITAGYGQTMPVYEGQLTEEDVLNLVSYIKVIGTPAASSPSSNVNRQSAPATASGANEATSLAANAVQANTSDPDATPTRRSGSPAVGAVAAEGRNR
jgi:cytochrome c oxidase subunit 2